MILPSDPSQQFGAPVLAVCGFSGSGKTTVLEAAIGRLIATGLSVAVVKHDAHGVIVDTPGKDSDRLFQAGATVALRAPNQQFQRRGEKSLLSLHATLGDLARDHDLILVEGHKDTPLPKFWLEDSAHNPIPDTVTNIVSTLNWDGQRLASFLDYVNAWLPVAWKRRPLCRGMLIGGKSSRMGSPKQLLDVRGRQLGEIVASALSVGTDGSEVAVLGAGPIPASLANSARLPDAIGFEGPFAGLLAAHRWSPLSAWIVAACDHPWLRSEDIDWLISLRRPGTWAVIPRQEDGHPCPILALYEPQALIQLERGAMEEPARKARMAALLDHPRTLIIDPPPEQRRAWRNVNTSEELKAAVTREI